MAQRRAEELLVKVGAINHAMEQIEPIDQTPQTPETSGLSLPAQLNINISTDCEQTRYNNILNFAGVTLSSISYIDQVI